MSIENYLILAMLTIIILIFFLCGVLLYFFKKIKNINCEKNTIKQINTELNEQNKFLKKDIKVFYKQAHLFEKEKEESISKEKDEFIKEKEKYKGKLVVVGDYMKDTSERTKKILMDFGFTVDIVNSGTDLINRIKYEDIPYDLIITNNTYKNDYYIDKQIVDGYKVLRELKSNDYFDIPIVVNTVSSESKEHFIELGFDGCIKKPMDHKQLKEVLDRVFK